jgi:hypothetical protein
MNLVLEDTTVLRSNPEAMDNLVREPRRQLRTSREDSQLATWREELDEYHEAMADFPSCEPSEIFRSLAAYSARASYIRGQVMRVDNRALTNFRTKELDPFINTLDYQFKVWSRYQTTVQMEWEISGNGRI